MIGYFDSSALVKLLVDEPDGELVSALWDGCDVVTSSRLACAEVPAAIAGAGRAHRLSPADVERALAVWDGLAGSVRWVELTPGIARAAGARAVAHVLSGADAVHLASAHALGPASTVCITWDRRLWTAARAEGLAVAPAALT
ncbi:type II toxin-antitoxin system VapC family toxin [Microbacterium sp. No. 7]|uniref:type II toxin-antitoxin system VapC family toxin n=1 Tax=Microbacterium sp. No. 7 TaxID=1714373 RepID=UPI0006D0C7D9|nr:type II toxin-antitoxin system VapC family toxin [Microbacterium sp. No. 7]ALJ18557.1 hypothetical protein AOA12_00965 [Microbacterium sp. No. 7]